MKYRQWKKNYKKKHEVNPPLWLEREKQRRYIRKQIRRTAASLQGSVGVITKDLETAVMVIKKRLLELQEKIVVKAARESEAIKNDKYITGYNSVRITGDIFQAGQTGREGQRE